MIINFFGIQLQVIDNGDGTFDIKPLDAVADKQAIRNELARLRAEKAIAVGRIDAAVLARDFHIEQKDIHVAKRLEQIAVRDALNVTIAELKLFLESAGDVDA